MRTLAIDLGGRRVGLALSDADGRLASPMDVLMVTDPQRAIDPIIRIIGEEGVARIVVGLPVNMDDSMGPAARRTIEWARALARRCNVPTIFVDERLSSFAAEQKLVDRKRAGEKLTRGRKKRQLDALAAAAFLQDYLDGKLPAIEVGSEVES